MSVTRSAVTPWRDQIIGRRSPLLRIYLVVAVTIGTAYYAFPDHHLQLWTPIGLLSVAAIVMGIRVHRPDDAFGWYVLAAGTLCFITGDTTYNYLTEILGQDEPLPSSADVFYLLSYPLFAGGLLLLIRRRTVPGGRGWILDSSIMTTAAGLVVWVYLVLPLFEDRELSTMQQLVSAAYPVGDVLLLAMLARLITGDGLWNRSIQLLAVGLGYLLASDMVFGLSQLQLGWERGGMTDLGWMVLYISWGAAALHPSMRQITTTTLPVSADIRLGRIVVLAGLGLIAPVMLLVHTASNGTAYAVSIGVFSAVLYLLVLVRLAGIVSGHRQSLAREQALRASGESLLTAQDALDVVDAALAAVGSLTSTVPDVDVALYLVGPDEVLRVAASSGAAFDDTDALWAHAISAGSGAGQRVDGPVSINALRFGHALQGMLVVRAEMLTPHLHGALTSLAVQVALALGSDRLAVELQQRQQEVHFSNLIQNSSDIILVLGTVDGPAYGLESLQRVLGLAVTPTSDELVGLCHPDDRETARDHVVRVRTRPADELTTDYWRLRDAHGDYLSFEVVSRNMLEDPTVAGIVLTMRDVSQRRALEDQLKHQAFHDGLTDIANRELFQARAAAALARIAGTPNVIAMVMLDLDDFKDLNDAHGHGTGDEVLRAVAKRLGAAMRPGDTAARLGGDEFAVLVEELPDAAAAEVVVARMLESFEEPFTVQDQLFLVGASAGLVVAGGNDRDIDLTELLLRADLALYATKKEGKSGFQRYEPTLRTNMLRRVSRRTELRAAVENEEFSLQYQPIVEIETAQVVGAEALIRWEHPRQGQIQPGEFIALAEETGLIVPLGRWVLNSACAQLGRWRGTPLAGLSVSVNVSALQLQEPAFVDDVRAAVERNEIEPQNLVLELTETVLFHKDAAIPEILSALRTIGVGVAIDDFGTGYSSLAYLGRYAVDVIKIDKSFIDGLGTGDSNAKALVRAVVSLAHELRLRIVAEGIERPAQAAELLALGCELGQGYLYAKPLRPVALAELLGSSLRLARPDPAVRLLRGLPAPWAAAGSASAKEGETTASTTRSA